MPPIAFVSSLYRWNFTTPAGHRFAGSSDSLEDAVGTVAGQMCVHCWRDGLALAIAWVLVNVEFGYKTVLNPA